MWVGIGLVLTMLPLLIVGAIALKTRKFDFGTICGLLCGAMANPMALSYANDTIPGERAPWLIPRYIRSACSSE